MPSGLVRMRIFVSQSRFAYAKFGHTQKVSTQSRRLYVVVVQQYTVLYCNCLLQRTPARARTCLSHFHGGTSTAVAQHHSPKERQCKGKGTSQNHPSAHCHTLVPPHLLLATGCLPSSLGCCPLLHRATHSKQALLGRTQAAGGAASEAFASVCLACGLVAFCVRNQSMIGVCTNQY